MENKFFIELIRMRSDDGKPRGKEGGRGQSNCSDAAALVL